MDRQERIQEFQDIHKRLTPFVERGAVRVGLILTEFHRTRQTWKNWKDGRKAPTEEILHDLRGLISLLESAPRVSLLSLVSGGSKIVKDRGGWRIMPNQ